jgi:hypothetical protein
MILTCAFQGENAERVCNQKFAFVTTRMISLGAAGPPKSMLCFTRSAVRMFMKYGSKHLHHACILRIVLSSQHTSSFLSFMIFSMVSAQ